MRKSWIVASVVALMGMQARGVVVSSTFDTGGEGWGVVTYGATDYTGTPTGYGAMPWISSGGNPGGYVRQTDPDGGDTFTIAPASFLGNAVRAYGTTLTYDLFDTGGNEYNAAAAVVLRGAGLTVCYTPATLPSTVAGTFTHFEIPLTETGWAMNGYGGAAVTAGQMQAVLGSLTMVGIRLEYHTGPDDSGLDNVVLPVLPSGMIPGDANLDGRVNADDYALIDRGFAKHLTGWANGDFNYDGRIDAADYLIIDGAYERETGEAIGADVMAERVEAFGEGYVSELATAVPEPGVGVVLGMIGVAVITCKR